MPFSYNFLREIASKLLEQHGTDELYRCIIILPSKRACAFLEHELSQSAREYSFIAPVTTTIDQWIGAVSGLTLLDKTALLGHFYQVYDQYLNETSSSDFEFNKPLLLFDRAEKMLEDFQDLDLALADPDLLFRNLKHLDELNSYDYLTDEQKEAIVQFWGTLPAHLHDSLEEADVIQRFVKLTETMRDLYPRFQNHLGQMECGYRGMLYRQVAEHMSPHEILAQTEHAYGMGLTHLYLVGLYALSPAESSIIGKLQQYHSPLQVELWSEGIALPFRKGMKFSPQWNHALQWKKLAPSQEKLPQPQISILSAHSAVLQSSLLAQIIRQIVHEHPQAIEQLQVAVVLNDERSLMPLLHSLQLPHETINVTMGFPLQATPVAIWLHRYLILIANQPADSTLLPVKDLSSWLQTATSHRLWGDELDPILDLLHKSYYYVEKQSLLEVHPQWTQEWFPLEPQHGTALLSRIERLLEKLLEKDLLELAVYEEQGDNNATEGPSYKGSRRAIVRLETEYIYRYRKLLVQLSNIIDQVSYFQQPNALFLLLDNLIAQEKMPFEGEPLAGLQVMGFLETRNLSFPYLIFLDVKEGQLPKLPRSTSLIPHSLRKAYGLGTTQEHDHLYAYHFYRLLNGAKRVFFIQDLRTQSLEKNTPSRFLDQLRYLTTLPIEEIEVPLCTPSLHKQCIVVQKDHKILEKLQRFVSSEDATSEEYDALSPSDINTYHRCPLRFYFQKIKKIQEPDQKEDFLTPITIGHIVHKTLQQLLQPFQEQGVPFDRSKIPDSTVTHVLQCAYAQERYHQDTLTNLHGGDKINLSNLKAYVLSALEIDQTISQTHRLDYLHFELALHDTFPLPEGGHFNLKGFVDRIDLCCDTESQQKQLRIIDYKTGQYGKVTPQLDWLQPHHASFEKLGQVSKVVQLYLYSHLFANTTAQEWPHDTSFTAAIYHLAPSSRGKLEEQQAYWEIPNTDKDAPPIIVELHPQKQAADSPSAPIIDQVRKLIQQLVIEILDPETPFTQTPEEKNCSYCPYATICGRTQQKQ